MLLVLYGETAFVCRAVCFVGDSFSCEPGLAYNRTLKIISSCWQAVREGGISMVITKYSLIGAVLQAYPSAEACFRELGMHCVSCHMSPRETLEQACQVHSCDVEELVHKLDRHINGTE